MRNDERLSASVTVKKYVAPGTKLRRYLTMGPDYIPDIASLIRATNLFGCSHPHDPLS